MITTLSQLINSDHTCQFPEEIILDFSFEAIHYRLYSLLCFFKTLTPELTNEILIVLKLTEEELSNGLNFLATKGFARKDKAWSFVEQSI